MIPVLIVPVVSRFDLLERMLASVDEPVGQLVIVDNSCSGYTFDPHDGWPFASVEHIRPIIGLGYPGGINAGIGQTPGAPWWMWASNDLIFGPSDLGDIVDLVEQDAGPVMVTGDRKDGRVLRNAYGAMNLAAVEAIGLFDEWQFFPAYFDDDDMERRCRLGGVEWVEYNGQIRHETSSTIKDPAMAARNQETYPENARRYAEKWGGSPGSEAFATPYGLPVPLSFTRPDLAGRARRAW